MHQASWKGSLAMRQIFATAAAVGLLFTLSPRAYAVSALPPTQEFWDSNTNGVPDDIGVKGYMAGNQGYWASGQICAVRGCLRGVAERN